MSEENKTSMDGQELEEVSGGSGVGTYPMTAFNSNGGNVPLLPYPV